MIARKSKNEAAVADMLIALATELRLEVIRDNLHNVLVRIPASSGYEHLPLLCLQSHTDMVCVKEDSVAEMFPIQLILNDNILTATDTTLGADNGIGVAAMMTIMADKTIPHGPLELLYTTIEEEGLVGAENFDYSLLQSKRILNLDSEEEGIIYVGCAGGGRVVGSINLELVKPVLNYKTYSIELSGLAGGHSGVDIHLGRVNAIKVLAKIFSDLKGSVDFSFISFTGGTAMNAIPSTAKAVILIRTNDVPKFNSLIPLLTEQAGNLCRNESLKFSIELVTGEPTQKYWNSDQQSDFLKLLTNLPDGVMSMEPEDKTMVQTSNNVGLVEMEDGCVKITSMFRSSLSSKITELGKEINTLFKTAHAETEVVAEYAPWEPQFNTKLLALLKRKYKEQFGGEPEVKTIHAGLECASFYKRMPGVEIVSFGPTMGDVHTTREWVDTDSVYRFYNLLLSLLIEE